MGQGGSKPLKSEDRAKVAKGLYKYDSGKCKDKLSGRKYRTADTTGWVLQKVYGVPDRYVGAYPKYTQEKALEDLKQCALGGALRHSREIVRFDKLTKGEDDRKFALKSIHGWTQREVDDPGLFARLPYSLDMARKDIAAVRRGSGKPRFQVTRGTSDIYDAKTGIMYSALTGPYVSGYEYTVGKDGKVNPSGVAPHRKAMSQYGLLVRDAKGTSVPRGSDLFSSSWTRPFTGLRTVPCGTFGLKCRGGQTSVTIEDSDVSAAIRAILVLAKDKRPSAAKQWDAIDRIAREGESGADKKPSAPTLTENLLRQFGLAGPKTAKNAKNAKNATKKSAAGSWLSSGSRRSLRGFSPAKKNLNSAHGAFYTGLFANNKNGRMQAFLANAARAGAPPTNGLNAAVAGNAARQAAVPGQPIPSSMRLTSSQKKRVADVAAKHASLTNAQKAKYASTMRNLKKNGAKTVEARIKRGELALNIARGGFDPAAKPRSAGKEDKEILARAGLLHPMLAGLPLTQRANVGRRDVARVEIAKYLVKKENKDETVAVIMAGSVLDRAEKAGYSISDFTTQQGVAKYYADLKKKAQANKNAKSAANKKAASAKAKLAEITALQTKREKLEAEYKKNPNRIGFYPNKAELNAAAKKYARKQAPSPSSSSQFFSPAKRFESSSGLSVTNAMIHDQYVQEYKRLAQNPRTRDMVKQAIASVGTDDNAARVKVVHAFGNIKTRADATKKAQDAEWARRVAKGTFKPTTPHKHASPARNGVGHGLHRAIDLVFEGQRISPSSADRGLSSEKKKPASHRQNAAQILPGNQRAEAQARAEKVAAAQRKASANRKKAAASAERKKANAAKARESANRRDKMAANLAKAKPKATSTTKRTTKPRAKPQSAPLRAGKMGGSY